MNVTEEKKQVKQPNNIILENREKLIVSGVSDVESFDDQTVNVFTDLGELSIRGEELHIIKLSVEIGELKLEGKINSLTYSEREQPKEGFFSRLFK